MSLFAIRSLVVPTSFFAAVFVSTLSFADGLSNASTGSEVSPHPLASTVRYCESHSEFIRTKVRDYSCRLIKRERINNSLQEPQFADLKVRCEHQTKDGTTEPLAVYMQFRAPRSIEDRRVLYVADQHDGKVLVRKGGSMMKQLRLSVDPHSMLTRSESKYKITEIGLDKLIDRVVRRFKSDMQHDPDAANTRVAHFRNAYVGKRKCTHIQVVHPQPAEGLGFHQLSLFVDDELHVPIRLIVHSWPKQAGGDAPILEEYNYLGLRLNRGLSGQDFSESLLDETADTSAALATSQVK